MPANVIFQLILQIIVSSDTSVTEYKNNWKMAVQMKKIRLSFLLKKKKNHEFVGYYDLGLNDVPKVTKIQPFSRKFIMRRSLLYH